MSRVKNFSKFLTALLLFTPAISNVLLYKSKYFNIYTESSKLAKDFSKYYFGLLGAFLDSVYESSFLVTGIYPVNVQFIKNCEGKVKFIIANISRPWETDGCEIRMNYKIVNNIRINLSNIDNSDKYSEEYNKKGNAYKYIAYSVIDSLFHRIFNKWPSLDRPECRENRNNDICYFEWWGRSIYSDVGAPLEVMLDELKKFISVPRKYSRDVDCFYASEDGMDSPFYFLFKLIRLKGASYYDSIIAIRDVLYLLTVYKNMINVYIKEGYIKDNFYNITYLLEYLFLLSAKRDIRSSFIRVGIPAIPKEYVRKFDRLFSNNVSKYLTDLPNIRGIWLGVDFEAEHTTELIINRKIKLSLSKDFTDFGLRLIGKYIYFEKLFGGFPSRIEEVKLIYDKDGKIAPPLVIINARKVMTSPGNFEYIQTFYVSKDWNEKLINNTKIVTIRKFAKIEVKEKLKENPLQTFMDTLYFMTIGKFSSR